MNVKSQYSFTSFRGGAGLSRRAALKFLGLGAVSLNLPGCRTKNSQLASSEPVVGAPWLVANSPIDRTVGQGHQSEFSGDAPDRVHRILWDKPGFISSIGGSLPKPSETADLVVVGGGMSGLLTAFSLRHHNPIVLERAKRFGGNSSGEAWNKSDYSIGAAYFMEPEAGSPISGLLKELSIAEGFYRVKTTEDPIIFKGGRNDDFWSGSTAPEAKKQFQLLHKYFKDTFDEKNGLIYPDIPCQTDDMLALVKKLDAETFRAHMTRVAGGKLHPHIETALEHFCWSSFGTSFSEVSAASGLNFYAGEFGNVFVAPGGNSAVAERALEKLQGSIGESRLRCGQTVFDVTVTDGGVNVASVDELGKVKVIRARAVVMACPKFAASRMVSDIELERVEAIKKLRYHSYLVANVLLNKPTKDDFYDLFMIGNGNVVASDLAGSSDRQRVTDIVLGTYAKSEPNSSILTLYRGIPYEGGRGLLYSDGAYERFKGEFTEQIDREILTLVGAAKKDVQDVRVTRWGHPLPSADAGLISGGVIDEIRKPFRDRVFFVEQDNWMLPAFETAAMEALTWAPKIDTFLKKGGPA